RSAQLAASLSPSTRPPARARARSRRSGATAAAAVWRAACGPLLVRDTLSGIRLHRPETGQTFECDRGVAIGMPGAVGRDVYGTLPSMSAEQAPADRLRPLRR